MANGPTSDRLTQLGQLVTQLGFPVVVSAFLLWFLLSRVDTSMKHIQEQEDLRTQKITEMQAALIGALDRQTERFERAIDAATKRP